MSAVKRKALESSLQRRVRARRDTSEDLLETSEASEQNNEESDSEDGSDENATDDNGSDDSVS